VARLDPPGRLFVTTDHYVMRMLYSQGVRLERAGLDEVESWLDQIDRFWADRLRRLGAHLDAQP
jgi:glucuronate isomerase